MGRRQAVRLLGRTPSSSSFTVEELKAANKFVKTIGDAGRAIELMDAMFGG
jgi:hypothetical protein